MTMTTIGDRIQQAMDEAGETYRSLAKKLHIAPTTLHDWVRKDVKISDKKLDEIGKHTNKKLAAWFRYADQQSHIDESTFRVVLADVLKINKQLNFEMEPEILAQWTIEICRLRVSGQRVDEDQIRRLMMIGRT